MGHNKITALITVFLTFILFIILQPGDNPLALIRVASIVAAIVLILIVVYTHFLWRVEPFVRIHRVTDISGKWEGIFPNKNGKEMAVEVRIKQYYDDIKVELITDHNKSESLVTKNSNDVDGSKLYIVYKCKPLKVVESKDEIDFGTIILRVDEDVLEGELFNSHGLSGHIELYRKE